MNAGIVRAGAIKALKAFQQHIAPPCQCSVCHTMNAQRVCAACIHRYAPPRLRCFCCALPLAQAATACAACLQAPTPFARTIAACDYQFPWNSVVDAFKSHDGLDRAQGLATMLAQAVQDGYAPGPARQESCDVVVPMPASQERMRERGYNPAWELARRVARARRLPTAPSTLRRVANPPAQRGLTRQERVSNVRGAFAVSPASAHTVQGRRVALVDDVMTTASTAAEATRVLLSAGAREVHVWVLARTPAPDG